MRTIITTVGTSLLNNAKRDLGTDQLDHAAIANYHRRTEPERASAETNSLSRLLLSDDRIVFLHSQTPEGEQCARALHNHYQAQGHHTELHNVPDLLYSESRFKMRGLRSLVATMIELVHKERKADHDVVINATGGFKAEIAYATLVGLLLDVPVYYIHEAFREIIEMPPTPINWDFALIAEHEDFFDWIHADLRLKPEVDQRLRSLPDDVHLLLTEDNGSTMLSPTGEAFYDAYHYKVETAPLTKLYLHESAKQTLAAAQPHVQALWKQELKKLANSILRKSSSERVRNGDCFVFPRGNRDPRIFYYEHAEAVYVCELTRHSDQSYERLLQRDIWRETYQRQHSTPYNPNVS